MEIRIRQSGEVVYENEFRALFPESSLPAQLTAEVLDELGADPVLEGAQAQPTRYQVSIRDGVEQIAGQWFTKYGVADMTQEQIDALDAQDKASNAALAKRELEETDWCENASVRNPSNTPRLANGADFDAYRLALRAIVINPPVSVETWPTRPTSVWVTE